MLYDSSAREYARATRPRNAVTQQRPRFVAAPTTEVAAAVSDAAERGLTVVPQATGHGAGAPVGDDALLLDTSALASVAIDAEARTARVGSGATWAAVNAAAFPHGLLGPAGSAASVSVSGDSSAGGVGWLVRRDGLASGAIRRVSYVDGSSRPRVARDDASEVLDRDALWGLSRCRRRGRCHRARDRSVPGSCPPRGQDAVVG
jgi:FAD/FMN-containing dehydrogenase